MWVRSPSTPVMLNPAVAVALAVPFVAVAPADNLALLLPERLTSARGAGSIAGANVCQRNFVVMFCVRAISAVLSNVPALPSEA